MGSAGADSSLAGGGKVFRAGAYAMDVSPPRLPVTELDGTERWFIGGRNDNFANFAGKIDEVAVYDRVLAPEEVARHYAASGPSIQAG